jgi:hypothetical protein
MSPNEQKPEQSVTVENGHIIIRDLDILDEDLAAYLGEFHEKERADVVRKAVKIGLIALKGSVTTEKIDYVEKEFNRLSQKLSKDLDTFTETIRQAFEKVFKEDGGIMKSTLERYLGTGGKLEDLFDPQRKDSAISKMSSIFEEHFKGKDSVLYRLLNHANPESPIASLKQELIGNYLEKMRDRIIGKEAAEAEREKGTAKGRTYQENVFLKINEICKPFQDTPEYTADTTGDIPLRIVIEAKDREKYTIMKIQKELDEAKENRDACVGIAVFTSDTCPLECSPLQQYGDDKVICICNQDDNDCLALNLAYRISRIAALGKLRGTKPQIEIAEKSRPRQ